MRYYLVSTSGDVNVKKEIELVSYGNVEEVSKLFNLYKFISDKPQEVLLKIGGVVEIREEDYCII